MQESLSFQQKSLVQQGYTGLSSAQLSQLDWGLRFTPVACSLLTLYGLYSQNPQILLLVSGLGIWAFFAPAAHPMDLLYNRVVRHLFSAIALPPNPFQRRLACLAAGVMNAASALLFLAEQPLAARALGAVLLVLQLIVITTHFCTLSWLYELIVKAMGRWERPLEASQAQALFKGGATLVDVREPNEFARGHLEGALNIPLSTLATDSSRIQGKVCLVYCASGMRSQMATRQLKQMGVSEVYNLGGLSRARDLLSGAP